MFTICEAKGLQSIRILWSRPLLLLIFTRAPPIINIEKEEIEWKNFFAISRQKEQCLSIPCINEGSFSLLLFPSMNI